MSGQARQQLTTMEMALPLLARVVEVWVGGASWALGCCWWRRRWWRDHQPVWHGL